MESTIQQMERISRIAYSKIPVSEESSIFNLFAERREVCKKLNKTVTETDMKYLYMTKQMI